MEAFGAFFDEEWESLSKLFSCEDSDLLLHFNGQGDEPPSLFPGGENVTGVEGSLSFPCGGFDTNFYCVSQESSNSSEADESTFFPSPGVENHQVVNGASFFHDATTNIFESMGGFCAMDGSNDGLMAPMFPDYEMEQLLQLKAKMICDAQLGNAEIQPADNREEMQLKRKNETSGINTQDNTYTLETPEANQGPKKRSQVSKDTSKSKRTPQPKKNKKAIHTSNDEEENNGGNNGQYNGQSSSTCSSEEDDSNASQELHGGSTSESKGSASTGKGKANRGPATDPQSLYARKRRERINERLRILQNLVPNGTKVDISTMLEEAVHYVKFLQLQIKLLSSDDHWMFAPIAYNGMDMGLYQKIAPNLCPQN